MGWSKGLGGRLLGGCLLAGALVAWRLAGPARFGGTATYLMVHGVSMLPRFHGGDLVVVRTQADYRVGEVAAYYNPQLGTLVLHRIVARAGDRYVFKGDNNPAPDPYHPVRGQLVGALWLHMAGGGLWVRALRVPRNAAYMVGVLAMGAVLGEAARRQEQQRRRRRLRIPRGGSGGGPVRWPALRGHQALLLAAGAGVLACLFLVLGAAAFGRAPTRAVPRTLPYRQAGSFSYAATVARDAVYPDGRVTTGDTVFLKLVPQVHVAFDYRFSSPLPHRVQGTEALTAVLRGASGWSRTFVLQPPRPFAGDSFHAAGTVSLTAMRQVIARVLTLVGMQTDQYTLVIQPRVSLQGTVGGLPLAAAFTPPLTLSIDPVELRPADRAFAATVHPTQAGALASTARVPNRIAIGPLVFGVPAARAIAVGGLLFALGLLLLALREVRRARPATEAEVIRARHGGVIVDMQDLDLGGSIVVQVANFPSLARIAAQYERLILHREKEGVHDFIVQDVECTYCYTIEAPADAGVPPAGDAPAVAEAEPADDRRAALPGALEGGLAPTR